jgi:hypothetical protein
MVDSDNQYLLPTPYNLGVNRKHFRNWLSLRIKTWRKI